MNFELIGTLVRLRYKLLWAKRRTRNGKIALFFAGYILLVMVIAILAAGGIGAGLTAVRTGKAHIVAAAILAGLYFQALLASVILGFGVNNAFTELELRRYPLSAGERRFSRHLIGILDPFWYLILALELGLVVGLYAMGAGSFWLGFLGVMLMFVSNYLLARIVALLVERLVQKKFGSMALLGFIIAFAMLPSALLPLMNKKGGAHLFQPFLTFLASTPPAAASTAMTRYGMDAFTGLFLLAGWIAGFLAVLVFLEKLPAHTRTAQATAITWRGPLEQVGSLFGPGKGPLVTLWLRFYLRNNRFRTIYPLSMPLVAMLAVTFASNGGKKGQFANALGAFTLIGCMGTLQFAVNQFGYLGGGLRRYFLLPVDPAAVLRTGSYTFVMLSSILIPPAIVIWTIFAPFQVDAHVVAMLLGGAITSLFLMHGIALWSTLLGPRKGNFNASFGNDLSLAGNIVVIGGMMLLLFLPRLLDKQWPDAVTPGNWWVLALTAPLAIVFYVFSLRSAEGVFRARREEILGVVEGRA